MQLHSTSLVFAFLLFFPSFTVAAGGPKDGRTYLSSVLEPTSKGKAQYYLIPEGKDGELFIGRIYTMSNELKAEGRYLDEALTLEEGRFVFYHANGKVESEGRFASGRKSGIWQRYDPWGGALAEKVYDPEPLLNIVYTRAESMPEIPGGERAFVQYLKEKVVVPSGTKLKRSMAATFIVEKSGDLSDVKVVDGDEGPVDDQVVDMIRSTAPWQPGADKGQPVRVQMRMPVQF